MGYISSTDHAYLKSILKIDKTEVRNQFNKKELSIGGLRHICSNYPEVSINKMNDKQLEECFLKYGRRKVKLQLRLIVNKLIADYMLEIVTQANCTGNQEE
jgi:hypothetical protein